MPAERVTVEAWVLDRLPAGEQHVRCPLLTPSQGILQALFRAGRRPPAPAPFERLEAALERSDSGLWFAREWTVAGRADGLASNLAALTAASRFARVLLQNPLDPSAAEPVFRLHSRALEAFAAGVRPDAVYLKAFYVLLRDEGFPVREEWAVSLTADDRAALEACLRTPAAGEQPSEALVGRLTASLERYATSELELRL